VLRERVEWLADEHGVEIVLDAPHADVLVTFSSIEIMKYPESLVATARVLNHGGYAWTLSTSGYEATNFGMLAGDVEAQRAASLKLIDAAIACGASLLLLPECGHAYSAMRWEGANMLGRPLPFRVLHVSEFLAESLTDGRLQVTAMPTSVVFHDPCQISRRGGAMSAPREVLAALGTTLREPEDSGPLAFCCGGGGGVIANHRADPLRYKAFTLRMQQLEATGAEVALTSCSNCRQSFDDGTAHLHQGMAVGSLVETVAAHLAPGKPRAAGGT